MKNLKSKVYRGLIWSSIDTFILKGLVFVSMIFIARVIGPKEFGFIGMISIFLGIGVTLYDAGMSASLIRTKKINDFDCCTVFYSNILISITVYSIAFFISPYVSDFFGYENLNLLIKVYSLIFLIMSLSAVQVAIFTKKMLFKKIAKINFLSTIIGLSLGVYLSLNDWGAWSVVLMLLTTEVIKTSSYLIYSQWKPKLIFSIKKFKYHFTFGYKLMLSGILNVIFKNIYNLIIGKIYEPKFLGYFERSRQLNEYPSSTITGVIERVIYPMMTEIKHDKIYFKKIYKKVLSTSLFFIAPIILFIAAISEPLFLIILGEDWLPAVPIFKIISFGSILYPISSFSLSVLKTYGRSDLFLKVEVIKKIILALSILFMFQFGLIGLVWSTVISAILGMLINIHYTSKIINYSIAEHLKDISLTLLFSIALFFIVGFFIKNTVFDNDYLKIIYSIIVGGSFYLIVNLVIKQSPIHYALILLKKL